MFTGIIEDIGRVVRVSAGAGGGRVLQIRTSLDPTTLAIGDSICTNGVCLTATSVAGDMFTIDAGPETLSRTTVGRLEAGAKVNLERSVTPSTRLGGHLVMGHVDAVGQVRSPSGRTPGICRCSRPRDPQADHPAGLGSRRRDQSHRDPTGRRDLRAIDHSPYVEGDDDGGSPTGRPCERGGRRDRPLRGGAAGV